MPEHGNEFTSDEDFSFSYRKMFRRSVLEKIEDCRICQCSNIDQSILILT